MQTRLMRHGGEILALAILYFVTARLSLLLAIPPGYATPIWPSAGIGLAAVLIFGNRVAPGIWLGSFLANVTISFDPVSAGPLVKSMLLPLGIGVGETIQAVAGAFLIRRVVGFPTSLQHVRDIVWFLGLGGPVSCVVSASVGVTVLYLTGSLPPVSYTFSWVTWWTGDTIGVFVATPLVLTWMGQPRKIWRRRRMTVAVPLGLACAAMIGIFVGAREEFLVAQHHLITWAAFAGGLMLMGMLGAFLLMVSGNAMLSEQLVVERTAELERTRQAEEAALQLAAIVTSSDDAIISKTLEGSIVSWNAGAERMFGYSASEMLGKSISILTPPELHDETHAFAERLRRGERVLHHETVRVHKDGRRIDVSLAVSPIRAHGGMVTGASAIMRDISERKLADEALREKEARIRSLVESNIIGVTFWNTDGVITDANEAFLQLSGYSREDLLSGSIRWQDITPAEFRASDNLSLEQLLSTGTCKPFEKEYICKDGSRIPVMVGLAMFKGSRDSGVSFVLDLSARKHAEQQMRHMADHDALTGLPNRTLLQDRLQQAIAFAHRNQRQVAILFIDLDYFKNINDSLGHHIGDVVLQQAAMRLQKCLREGDSVARLGGDEFVLILPLLGDSRDAGRVAQKALKALAQPFSVEGHDLHISGSIGISLYPGDGADVDALMRTADTAMYHAKEMGRGNSQFFTPALNQAAQQRFDMGIRLRQALAQNEFVLHYQPQVDMNSGMTYSTEALLRWQPPETAPISCGAFIANAEESGLIVPIGEWALREACRQLKIWHDAGHPELKMAVNLSPRQLEQAGFCNLVGQILLETGIPGAALELEITESILLQRSEFNLATLTRLSGMGIQLTVDDFGTGYSSLAYLQRFPVHALKIDQSFVRRVGKDSNNTALVTAIIAMAASLHLEVIAEGVETSQQARFLLAHGCHQAQGFYYSKAVPADALSEFFGSDQYRAPLAP